MCSLSSRSGLLKLLYFNIFVYTKFEVYYIVKQCVASFIHRDTKYNFFFSLVYNYKVCMKKFSEQYTISVDRKIQFAGRRIIEKKNRILE